jgi:Domain of unknown function (DUF4388)
MALTGQLSDLSLTELIEFFCNQRKTGRLKVAYTPAPGFFYFQSGDLVDAKIGVLNGVDAVYYALTLHNASFKFSPSFATTRRTIHQPWTQVALEGLRRLDEGIKPEEAFVDGDLSYLNEPEYADDHVDDLIADELAPEIKSAKKSKPVSPLSLTVEGSAENGKSKMPVYAAVAAAVVLIVAAVGFPAGWYSKKAAPAAAQQQPTAPPAETAASNTPNEATPGQPEQAAPEAAATDTSASDAAQALAARRALEARERMKAAEKANALAKSQDTAAPAGAEAVKKPEAAKPGPKMASVQVTYDEAGRVTSASGGDSNAIRIARQKRFPAGKAGSTTVTIPIN